MTGETQHALVPTGSMSATADHFLQLSFILRRRMLARKSLRRFVLPFGCLRHLALHAQQRLQSVFNLRRHCRRKLFKAMTACKHCGQKSQTTDDISLEALATVDSGQCRPAGSRLDACNCVAASDDRAPLLIATAFESIFACQLSPQSAHRSCRCAASLPGSRYWR